MQTSHLGGVATAAPTAAAPALWPHFSATELATLGTGFATRTPPTPLPAPHWVACNDALREALGLPTEVWAQELALRVFSGNAVGGAPATYASVYSGHQFGQWAGQLGDGRALNLGALHTPRGRQEFQLKGAGPTPYSRGGDGRAVLRSSIREFLASEAMHGLGVPTTRALCLSGSPAPVRRETLETAAVVTRVAPSFVRFGHFEHFAATGQMEALQSLADHVVDQHFAALAPLQGAERYAALLREVALRTAELMAHWQAQGFCHGVMNTDNMSVLGLTLDYGPFQFLDGFDANHICNHSDTAGRYAYARQPQVAYWNLFCLGQALMPLIGQEATAVAALEHYKTAFPQAMDQQLRRKLGLADAQSGDRALAEALLQALQDARVDYPVFWRRLSVAVRDSEQPAAHAVAADAEIQPHTPHHPHPNATVPRAFEPVRDLFIQREAFDAWLVSYLQRLGTAERRATGEAMLRVNPKYTLRNHLGELAIRRAQQGDFSMVQQLLHVLQNPFDEHPAHEDWAGLAPEWASSIEISCSS